ncbi:MAG: phosphatase PAP2 family protein [Steroidobacteraceae bacterium]
MRTRIGPGAAICAALLVSAFATPTALGQDAAASPGSGAQASQTPQASQAPQQAPTAGPLSGPIEYSKRESLLAATLGDMKAYYTAPLHWNARDWEYFGGVVAAIGVADHYDTQARTHFDSGSTTPLGPASSGELTDALPAAAALVGTWGYATLIGSHAGHTEAWNMLESAGLSVVTSYVVSYPIGRERPDQTTDPNRWFHGGDSFPSDHVAAAFAIGAVLAESGNPEFRWLRRVLGYGIGFGTAYLRMRHNAHWLSDTVAGAALGTATARFVMGRSEEREGIDSAFSVEPIPGGVMFAYSVSLPE